MDKRLCENCGIPLAAPRRRYCSKKCQNTAYYQTPKGRAAYQRAKAKARALGRRTMYPAVCVVCGAEFRATIKGAKYCSTGAGSCEVEAKRGIDLRTGLPARGPRQPPPRHPFGRLFGILAALEREPARTESFRYQWMLHRGPCSFCGTTPARHRRAIVPGRLGGWRNQAAVCGACARDHDTHGGDILGLLLARATAIRSKGSVPVLSDQMVVGDLRE